ASSALDPALASLSAHAELHADGLVVWNAQDVARDAPVSATLPAGWTPGAFRLIDASRGEEVAYQPDAGGISFVARDVPARGWRVFRFLRGAPTPPSGGSLAV